MGRRIIFACDLTQDFVGQDSKFKATRVHVGRSEIHRLFGAEAGGKLPTFLKISDDTQRERGEESNLVFVRSLHNPKDPSHIAKLERYGNHNLIGTPGAEFADPIKHLVRRDRIIDTSGLYPPTPKLERFFQDAFGIDLLKMTTEERGQIHLLLVGVHTDKGILNLANLLRNQLNLPNVAVCPHFVGSNDQAAHYNALQNHLPNTLIRVIEGIHETAEFIGLKPENLGALPEGTCKIDPLVSRMLHPDQEAILRSIFLGYEQVDIDFLGGGFSGSALLIAKGKRAGANMEPIVLKIDHYTQMRLELSGYQAAKKYLGNMVPTFGASACSGDLTGVAMELACMKGQPKTLQSIFEQAKDAEGLNEFLVRLSQALEKLGEKLYKNTRTKQSISTYASLGLGRKMPHADWLRENILHIVSQKGLSSSEIKVTDDMRIPNFIEQFEALINNNCTTESDTCLTHGDLNFANLISDGNGNIWAIDWTHVDQRPVEIDFTKMESDLKFVMTKEIEAGDLKNLSRLEAYLIDHLNLPELNGLPPDLSFVQDDFKFQKLYTGVKALRDAYLCLKNDLDPHMYHVGLLRFAAHNLSYDRRLGKGECTVPQLKYALLSTNLLVDRLSKPPHNNTNG